MTPAAAASFNAPEWLLCRMKSRRRWLRKRCSGVTCKLREAHIDILPKKAKKRGETAAVHWLEWALKEKVLVPGGLLLTDNVAGFLMEGF